jgi:hypothetical protein
MVVQKKAILGVSRSKRRVVIVDKAQTVVVALENNPNFPDSGEVVSQVKTLLTDISGLEMEKNRLQSQLGSVDAQIDEKIAKLYNALNDAVAYVNMKSNGDEAKIVSSGFEVPKDRTPIGALPKVMNVVLKEGLGSGELLVSFKNLRGARTYVIEVTYTVMDESSWVLGTYASGSRGNVLPRLKAGAQIWVRVAGVGAKGRGAWSDVASRFVP